MPKIQTDEIIEMLIDEHLLDKVTAKAKASPYIPPAAGGYSGTIDFTGNRVFVATKNEINDGLSTVIKVLFYNDDRVLTTEFLVNPLEGVYGVHIPAGQWHTLEVLDSGTVIFEVKDGPYVPLQPEDIIRL
ncbi:WbuC family cupin fold metalloprotein [Proteiniphilum propionicum]|nr:WbuC family cupin fold metalloprotein [Proteiniphilum propionicum]